MSRARIANGLALAGVVLLAAQLHADPNTPATPTPVTSSAPSDGTPDPNNLSSQEMQTQGTKMVGTLNDDAQHAQIAQAKAHKAQDILMVNCVNDGLMVTKQLTNVGEDALAKLEKAVQANDRKEQVTQFQTLTSAVKTADQTKQNIDGCVGASEIIITNKDGSKVAVIHPYVRDNPTTDCNNLGIANCASQPLEYVGFASPFTPN